MKAHQAVYPIATMCRVLGVSTSGYYAWRKRPPSARAQANAVLGAKLVELHTRSREVYGAPKLHADLKDLGLRVGRNRVARLMVMHGIKVAGARAAARPGAIAMLALGCPRALRVYQIARTRLRRNVIPRIGCF